jgi:hypothetical protein
VTASSGAVPDNNSVLGSLITNADQGVSYSWADCLTPYGSSSPCTPQFYLSTVTNGSASTVTTNIGYGGTSYFGTGYAVPVQPTLQRADGSYIGTLTTSTGSSMIAFTPSGQQLWTQPNDTPQIATADGGVIGGSGATYDQHGNVNGQIGPLPIYSFKAAYQLGSIEQVQPVSELANIGTTLASVFGGNLTGNGTSIVHQTFALNWCANQACQLSYAQQWGGNVKTDSNVDFYYQMAQAPAPSPLPAPVELNASQIAVIENQALSALQQAFHAFPSRVLSTGSNLTSAQYTHMAEVSGSYFIPAPNGLPPCGLTVYPRNASTVWYPCNLSQAQWALNLQATNLSQSTGSASFLNLLQAVGEGIGNNAAHEIAHQFLSDSSSCLMNDNPSLVGVYNGGSAKDPAIYTGIGSNGVPIHWSEQTAFCLAQMILDGTSLNNLQGLQP